MYEGHLEASMSQIRYHVLAFIFSNLENKVLKEEFQSYFLT